MPSDISRIPELVSRLYEVVAELEELFPGRHFTPDGHLVGSIGEVWAAHIYGLRLAPASTEGHDAVASDGRRVEIKVTQGSRVALSADSVPEHLIVLHLLHDGTVEETYNGPGAQAWEAAGPKGKNGQRPVSLARLSALMTSVPSHARIARRAI